MRLSRRQLILVKKETSYGVDPTPVAASDAIKSRLATPGQDITSVISENVTDTFSPQAGRVGRIISAIPLELEFTTNGDCGDGDILNPMRLDPILRAGALDPDYNAEASAGADDGSIVYTPKTDDPDSMTLYFYSDGVLYKALGCYTNLVWAFTPGELIILTADVRGIYATPTDEALPTPTYDEVTPPIAEEVDIHIGSYEVGIYKSMELNMNTDIPERLDLQSNVGLKGLIIANREPRLSMSVEATTEADKAFWEDMEDGAVEHITIVVDDATAGKITFDVPKAQCIDIGHSDDNGILVYDTEWLCTDNGSGDDELSLTFEA